MPETSTSTHAAAMFMPHYGFVRAMSVRFAPWPGLVDDIAQQVFVEYMNGADRWDLQSDLRPLLLTITRRTASRLWKQAMEDQPEKMRRLAEHIRMVADRRDETFDQTIHFDALKSCMQRLPQGSRTLLDWYYFQDVSTIVIGERLKVSRETVHRAISRVRDRLRKCVEFSMHAARGATDV